MRSHRSRAGWRSRTAAKRDIRRRTMNRAEARPPRQQPGHSRSEPSCEDQTAAARIEGRRSCGSRSATVLKRVVAAAGTRLEHREGDVRRSPAPYTETNERGVGESRRPLRAPYSEAPIRRRRRASARRQQIRPRSATQYVLLHAAGADLYLDGNLVISESRSPKYPPPACAQ